ncbi:helix-turn-helix domain-containing protein [Streptomyces sp. NPDC000410]|uniref:helix-turn-helix domain-containing protein n=1 Tax=Streptomyces sp. NPDC000410 TaxID=3154254 RepID=UPI00331F4445
MARLSRAETQQRTRGKVLAAARHEFAERGFRAAKIDAIAQRAELTRGAVYSNFPGKRALYFAVLADLAARPPSWEAAPPRPGRTDREALGALARAWVARLPPADAGHDGEARLGADLMPEVLADPRVRLPYLQLMRLDALLAALALEQLRPPEVLPGAPPRRRVRLAETVLTTLHGASRMAAVAPGFVAPFDIVSAAEQLAGLRIDDWWCPPDIVAPAQPADERWAPPAAVDVVRGEAARLDGDGVVAFLGLHRLAAAEQLVRAAAPGDAVTAVLVTGEPGELGPLARLVLAELCGCLREAFPRSAWPRLQVVCDESGAVAAAAGVLAVSDATETAVRVTGGRIVARADGSGSCHAMASDSVVPARSPQRSPRRRP